MRTGFGGPCRAIPGKTRGARVGHQSFPPTPQQQTEIDRRRKSLRLRSVCLYKDQARSKALNRQSPKPLLLGASKRAAVGNSTKQGAARPRQQWHSPARHPKAHPRGWPESALYPVPGPCFVLDFCRQQNPQNHRLRKLGAGAPASGEARYADATTVPVSLLCKTC